MERFYLRKVIHISMISIFLLEAIFSKEVVLLIIFIAILMYTISEIFRVHRINFPVIQDITIACTEQKNLKRFGVEPIYFGIGIFLLLLFFPKVSFYLGSIALILGDGFAGLVGRKFGKNRIFYNKKKTIEGSIVCFITTFFFASFFVNFIFALIVAMIATLIETLPIREENLILPLSVGVASLFLR